MAVRFDEHRIANRSFLFDNSGNLVAHYDKIHLFSAKLSDTEQYNEAETISAWNTNAPGFPANVFLHKRLKLCDLTGSTALWLSDWN